MDDADESTGKLLLDSNIWIREVGLMSKRASTLRLYMQDRRKRLVVPEVVQTEAARHLAQRMREQARAGRKAHEQLVRMFGRLSEWRIPSDEEIAEQAERLARGVDVPADRIELQPDTALRGTRRCLARSEVVTDKGYHSNDTTKMLKDAKIRGYQSEPDRGRRRWKDREAQAAVYANRRRIRGTRGRALQRRRAEYAERSFAHTYESGGLRRTHLRGHANIYKRLSLHGSAFNLGLAMRKRTGCGTPRGLRALGAVLAALAAWLRVARGLGGRAGGPFLTWVRDRRFLIPGRLPHPHRSDMVQNVALSTAC